MTTNWQPPNIPAPPAPEAKQSWFARHKILTAILALVAVVVLGQAVSGGDEPSPVSGTASAASATPDADSDQSDPAEEPEEPEQPGETEEPEPAAAKVGTPVRDGQFEFTVTKVQQGVAGVGSDVFGEKAQGQFVLIHVTVENIGDDAQYFSDSDQKVRDAKGREFSADTGAGIYVKDNDVFLNEINPGNTVKGVLVYDMPKGARPASIELHDSPFSGGVTVRLG